MANAGRSLRSFFVTRRIHKAVAALTSRQTRNESPQETELARMRRELARLDSQYPGLWTFAASPRTILFTSDPRTVDVFNRYSAVSDEYSSIVDRIGKLEKRVEEENRRKQDARQRVFERNRYRAVAALGKLADAVPRTLQCYHPILDSLRACIEDKHTAAESRMRATRVFGYYLRNAWQSGSTDLAIEAIACTAAPLESGIGSILHDALCSEDPDIRCEAATALARIRDVNSVPNLIVTLTDPIESVRLRATEALAWLCPVDFGEDVERWEKWWLSQKSLADSKTGPGVKDSPERG